MVVGNKDLQFKEILDHLPEDKIAVDLVGFMATASNGAAQGIAW